MFKYHAIGSGDIACAFVDLMPGVVNVVWAGGGGQVSHSQRWGPWYTLRRSLAETKDQFGPFHIRISSCNIRELKPGHPFRSLAIIDSGIV